MDLDNRKHSRFNPKGLRAKISITPPAPNEEILLEGEVIDMSYSGIKIKLFSAMPDNIPISKIKITVSIPELGIPVNISGVIKYMDEETGCGLHFADDHSEDEVDALLFECIKKASELLDNQQPKLTLVK